MDYPEAKDPLEIGRPKTASGIIVYLMEELGDARLRCAQLKQYIKTAQDLIDKSEEKDHIFEVASHLIQGIPDVLFRLDKALDAAALGAARLDYEEIKQGLKPEKVDELEEVLKDVRLHYLNRRSKEPVTTKKAADTLDRIAETLELTGELPLVELLGLAASLEGQSKLASEGLTPRYIRAIAEAVRGTPNPSRQHLAQAVRVLAADGLACGKGAGAGEDFQKENPEITDEQAAKIDAEHEKNKDVVKDKSAADDKALKIKKDDTFSSGTSGHDYPGSFFEIPGLSDRDGKVLAKIVGNMLPSGWGAEWLGSKDTLEASPEDTSAEYGPDAYRDWVSSGDHNQIKRVIEKFIEDLAPKGKTAVDTTKEEWQEALKRDEAMLKKYEEYVKKLEHGEKVENLSLENAKKGVQSLKEVIKNKKSLLSKLASEDVTMDWNTLISRYATSEQDKSAADKKLQKDLDRLLGNAQSTLDNGNTWKGEFEGFKLWVGGPSGSRSSQYEYDVRDPKNRSVQGKVKSFSALAKKMADAIEHFRGSESKLASEDVTMDWNTLISRYATSEQDKSAGAIKPLDEAKKGDRVEFTYKGEKLIGKVIRVKKDGVITVDPENSDDEDLGWVDIHPSKKTAASLSLSSEEAKESRFTEGQPADPTENMSPEDAKKWKEMHDKYKDTIKNKQAMVIQGGRDLGAFVKDVLALRASYKKHSKGIKNVRAQVKADPDWDSMVPVIDKLIDSVIRASEDADALERLLPSEYLKAAADVVQPPADPVSPTNLTPVFGDAMVAEAMVKLLDSSRKANVAQGAGNYKKMFFHLLGVLDAVGTVGKAFDIKSVGLLFRVWKEYAHLSGARPTTNFSAAVANEKQLAEEALKSRFEEGKPADPTENMSPEDAKKWKEEHDKNKDNFKAATDDDKESRFEEGKPADPTENMSPEDAKKWKEEHDKNKDNFKA